MAYIYDRSPGGDKLSVTRCEEHGGLVLTAHSSDGRLAVPVCVAPEDIAEIIGQMWDWAPGNVRSALRPAGAHRHSRSARRDEG